jgi:hypothetical protein
MNAAPGLRDDYRRARLIDAFLAAVRRRGLDVGQAVEFLTKHGLQRPAIAVKKPAAMIAAAEPTLLKISEAA